MRTHFPIKYKMIQMNLNQLTLQNYEKTLN